jgi:hypothetical protein
MYIYSRAPILAAETKDTVTVERPIDCNMQKDRSDGDRRSSTFYDEISYKFYIGVQPI